MTTESFDTPSGHRLAYRRTPAPEGGVTFVWLCGFKSDMTGGKAMAVEAWAQGEGHGALLFDYSGHGQSGGRFEEGTISAWREDALAAADEMVELIVESLLAKGDPLPAPFNDPHRVREAS
jgi:esterase/lipase